MGIRVGSGGLKTALPTMSRGNAAATAASAGGARGAGGGLDYALGKQRLKYQAADAQANRNATAEQNFYQREHEKYGQFDEQRAQTRRDTVAARVQTRRDTVAARVQTDRDTAAAGAQTARDTAAARVQTERDTVNNAALEGRQQTGIAARTARDTVDDAQRTNEQGAAHKATADAVTSENEREDQQLILRQMDRKVGTNFGDMLQPRDPREWGAIPEGTRYYAPDNKVYVKGQADDYKPASFSYN